MQVARMGIESVGLFVERLNHMRMTMTHMGDVIISIEIALAISVI